MGKVLSFQNKKIRKPKQYEQIFIAELLLGTSSGMFLFHSGQFLIVANQIK
jgi:hypothetical protein